MRLAVAQSICSYFGGHLAAWPPVSQLRHRQLFWLQAMVGRGFQRVPYQTSGFSNCAAIVCASGWELLVPLSCSVLVKQRAAGNLASPEGESSLLLEIIIESQSLITVCEALVQGLCPSCEGTTVRGGRSVLQLGCFPKHIRARFQIHVCCSKHNFSRLDLGGALGCAACTTCARQAEYPQVQL